MILSRAATGLGRLRAVNPSARIGFSRSARLKAESKRSENTGQRNGSRKESASAAKPTEDTAGKPEEKMSAGHDNTSKEFDGEEHESQRTTGEAQGASQSQTWARVNRALNIAAVLGIGSGGVWAYLNQDEVMEKIRFFTEPSSDKLLPDPVKYPGGGLPPRTLVIELDDTLVHSMWSRATGWRHTKRPGVEAFLAYLSSFYEIVLFTSQPTTYADPILDKLDPSGYIMHRLYRDATKFTGGVYVKDLSKLNRDLARTIVIDTDSHALELQPSNALLVPKWDRDPMDRTLLDLIPMLENIVRDDVQDVRPLLASYYGTEVAKEYSRRRSVEIPQSTQSRFGGLTLGSGLIGGSDPQPVSTPPPTLPSSGTTDSSEETGGGSLFKRLRK
mmetsp:Transcript_18694/g.27035  ORF Transcript_18694/g.27035 Transcript_18694/m.27035 type:complete len:388 (-) Transcript_18694:153-1316(-)|eukprot:CAMPEP_0184745326 /NCGR_PEP_ID=MMETSP0315-20130426/7974_1 /TAXON_ID=101924 /ORGANISM="Rhodosorus marinus, Strain UTEX LB 2760" /LENGTH=387 /DNA_ID=CAMNT_0027217397 /DNA_START=110 /DNA_END=1273 /DNA_ORIENTATION=+